MKVSLDIWGRLPLQLRVELATSKHKVERLEKKISKLKKEVGQLNNIQAQLKEVPDKQISLTDPDARSMATSGHGTGMVAYNVQTAVDSRHHISWRMKLPIKDTIASSWLIWLCRPNPYCQRMMNTNVRQVNVPSSEVVAWKSA